MKKLKVALVHDYIKEYGGAERVLEALHDIFPEAPIFTSVYIPSFLGPHQARFRGWDIRTSILQYIPFKQKLISPFRLLSPWVFKQFDLSGYDLVIVSATGAYFPNAVKTRSKKPPKRTIPQGDYPLRGVGFAEAVQELRIKGDKERAVHICYCHTPPRYLYGYATARDWKRHRIFAILGAIANHFLRMVDFRVSKNVDSYIANSEEVAFRIKKFYRREAKVIYPPVEVKSDKKQEARTKNQGEEEYYLTGGRLARAKHTDLVVQACEELGVALKVFGRGFAGYETRIKNQESRIKGKRDVNNIEFLGEVSDEEKMELMRGARAFIFAGEDEDFGIVPVEAMGAGVPVIAYRSGGVKETVVEGNPSAGSGQGTGVFFEELSSESLKKAIRRFEKMKISASDCRKQAEKFSKEIFKRNIKGFVEKVSV